MLLYLLSHVTCRARHGDLPRSALKAKVNAKYHSAPRERERTRSARGLGSESQLRGWAVTRGAGDGRAEPGGPVARAPVKQVSAHPSGRE